MSRNAMLAKIHIAKKDLGLDDDLYRDTLEDITGQRSASKLNGNQLNDVLTTFRKQGWKPKKKSNFVPDENPQVRKVFALWGALYRAGKIDNGSKQALDAFVKRQTKVDALKWCDPAALNKVIEGLKDMCARHSLLE